MPPFALAWTIISSRTGIIVMICAGLFLWHTVDKSSAVRAAVVEYVAHTELATARAERDEHVRRAAIFKLAAAAAEQERIAAEKDAEAARKRISEYEQSTPVAADGRVSADLYGRLRNK